MQASGDVGMLYANAGRLMKHLVKQTEIKWLLRLRSDKNKLGGSVCACMCVCLLCNLAEMRCFLWSRGEEIRHLSVGPDTQHTCRKTDSYMCAHTLPMGFSAGIQESDI